MTRAARILEIFEMALRRISRVSYDRHNHLGDSCPACIASTALEKAIRVPPDL